MKRRLKFVLVILALAALAGGAYFASRSGTDPEIYSNDFNVYYFAAREILAGRDPYQRSLGPWTPYLYPPFLAEALVPLALLPLPVAAYLWFLLSAVSIGAAAWMSAHLAGDEPDSHFRLVCAVGAVVIVSRFVVDTFDYGQVNNLLAAFAVAHVYLYWKNKKLASAVALALAISIKLTPAVLIFYHLAKRRWGFAVNCVALVIAITILSFLPFGSDAPGAFEAFMSRTVENQQGFDFAYAGNQSLRGTIARLQDNQPATLPTDAITLMASTAILVLAFITALFARSEVAAAAPFCCCLVLLSPLSWKAHFVVLVLPIAYLIFETWKEKSSLRWLIACGLAGAFILFNLTSPKVVGLAAAEWADAHSLVFAGALLIYFASIACVILQRRSGDEAK